jgi:glycogen debranching enzyme
MNPFWILLLTLPLAGLGADLDYVYSTARLGGGQSFGNRNSYVTLDRNADIPNESGSGRFGLRESTDQKYYLLGWKVQVSNANGIMAEPTTTIFHPESQETVLRVGQQSIRKEFFLPFEYGYTRTAHYRLEAPAGNGMLKVTSTLFLPLGSKVSVRKLQQWNYAEVAFPGIGAGVIWSSDGKPVFSIGESHARSEGSNAIEVKLGFDWPGSDRHREVAISFAYTPGSAENVDFLLDALFDRHAAGSPSAEAYLQRLHLAHKATANAIRRYLTTSRLLTPDPVINRAAQWAKITQLRLQQEYRSGEAFTNNPPSDIVVGRDSMWYLMGSSYYAQAWSRKLLDFWFRNGLEPSGKFAEYLAASREPLFQDDYGLNVNDNTPLLMLAAHHYYSLTGDKGFLYAVYPALLRSANLILQQREVGLNNHYSLIWCDSTETFVRGLCGWRNAIRDYNLAGAVTELNVECYQALLMTAELAREIGDHRNARLLESAARDLYSAIQSHLRDLSSPDSLYYLNINPAGVAVKEHTADLLFPILYGISDTRTSHKMLAELFSPEFWVTNEEGAGGFRTVSSKEAGFVADATPASYGLLGGVWPNLALWIARAASLAGSPDLSRRALHASAQLTEVKDPAKLNVVPGEFPEYFNGSDLKQRGMPLSSFVPGIYIWSATESFLGLAPHAAGLTVEPQLPEGWRWVAVSRLPYRGAPVSILALRDNRTVYTTVPLQTSWKQIQLTPELQDKYTFEPSDETFGLVIPEKDGNEFIAVSNHPQDVTVLERGSGRQIATLSVPDSGLARETIH